jgi:hypothetical protein
MDTRELRRAYGTLIEAAATPGLGEDARGGWNADQILAHVLSVDAATAAVALGVIAGARPAFDNRISLDRWNLDRIIAEHAGREELIDHVWSQSVVLCDIADQLSGTAAAVLVPTILLSDDALLLDRPVPLADLINGLAENHVPAHAQQLLALRAAAPGAA